MTLEKVLHPQWDSNTFLCLFFSWTSSVPCIILNTIFAFTVCFYNFHLCPLLCFNRALASLCPASSFASFKVYPEGLVAFNFFSGSAPSYVVDTSPRMFFQAMDRQGRPLQYQVWIAVSIYNRLLPCQDLPIFSVVMSVDSETVGWDVYMSPVTSPNQMFALFALVLTQYDAVSYGTFTKVIQSQWLSTIDRSRTTVLLRQTRITENVHFMNLFLCKPLGEK